MDKDRNIELTPKTLSELLADKESQRVLSAAVLSIIGKEFFGRRHDSFNIDRLDFLAAGVASAQYSARRMKNARRFNSSPDLLSFAASEVTMPGLILEFGVFSGHTINHLAKLMPSRSIHGFDSFQGLPDDWRPGFGKGCFVRNDLPSVPDNVELVVGWFDHTLPPFCDLHSVDKAALVHVDCDIYSSTQTIFANLREKIVPGTIIVFDEYYNYPGWELHEFRAFQEYVSANQVLYKYIGLVPEHQQVAVKIVG
jgi:hypothetical protein